MAIKTETLDRKGRTVAAESQPEAATLPLTDEMLRRFEQRAARYDQEERFFQDDFDELQRSGYLLMAVPRELGGLGLNLAEVCREQRKLGYYAHADALAVNMHLYWTGLAADLWRAGDRSLEWLLQAAADGAVLAAGHAESGNDIPVLLSTTRAERVEGGYRFYGRKSFGSLSPVWTFLGIHGMDMSDPAKPMVIHAFMPRDTEGFTVVENWDVMGMRATRSEDTVLDGAFVPDRYIGRKVAAGAAWCRWIGSLHAWRVCLGPAGVWQRLLRAGSTGPGPVGRRSKEKNRARRLPVHGLSPRRAACHSGDGA
jgi:alkylation response protein AidB-like acyl-CoA dehydrogenase